MDPTTGKVMYDGKETGVTIPGTEFLVLKIRKTLRALLSAIRLSTKIRLLHLL